MPEVSASWSRPESVSAQDRWEARIARDTMLLLGLGVLVALVRIPSVGLDLVWGFLVPVLPLVLVMVPGVWRNLCPLATVAEHGERLFRGRVARRRALLRPMRISGLLLLAILVPLRPAWFDISGMATLGAMAVLGALALVLGASFEGKSGWCGSACPVYSVERLLGRMPLCSVPNTRCDSCVDCCDPCPESGAVRRDQGGEEGVDQVVLGVAPGFVWGWFHIPTAAIEGGLATLPEVYLWCLGPALVSYLGFLAWQRIGEPESREWRERVFAFLAVALFYFFQVPAMLGFSGSRGVFLDLHDALPTFTPFVLRCLTTSFLAIWILARRPNRRGWSPEVERDPLRSPLVV